MTKLQSYINEVGQTEIARQLGISRAAVNHWMTGHHKPSWEMCHELERISGGYLKRYEIRPDIFGDAGTGG